jgi:hypothetical protein
VELFVLALMYQADPGAEDPPANLRAGPAANSAAGARARGGGAVAASAVDENALSVSTFAIAPVTALTQGVIAAAITMVVVLICAHVFSMGNSRQRKPPGRGTIAFLRRVYKWLSRRLRRLRRRGCRKRAPDEEEDSEEEGREAQKPAEEDDAPEGMVYVTERNLTRLGWVMLVGGAVSWPCCNLFALLWCTKKRRILVPEDDPRAIQQAENEAKRQQMATRSQQAQENALSTVDGTKIDTSLVALGRPLSEDEPAANADITDVQTAGGAAVSGEQPVTTVPTEPLRSRSPIQSPCAERPHVAAPQMVVPPSAELLTEGAPLAGAACAADAADAADAGGATSVAPAPSAAPAAAAAAQDEEEAVEEGSIVVVLRREPGQCFGLGLDFEGPEETVKLSTLSGVGAQSGELQLGDTLISINRVRVSANSDFGVILPSTALMVRLLVKRGTPPPASAPASAPPTAPPAPSGAPAAAALTSPPPSPPSARMSSWGGRRGSKSPRVVDDEQGSGRRDLKRSSTCQSNAMDINKERALGGLHGAGEARKFTQMRRLEKLERERQMKKEMRLNRVFDSPSVSPPNGPEGSTRLRTLARQQSTLNRKRDLDLASVAVQQQLRQKRKELRWRSDTEYYARLSVAWAFQFTIMGIAQFYAIICAISFGNRQTTAMCIAWLVAYGWTFAIVEPFQVIVLAGAPCMFDVRSAALERARRRRSRAFVEAASRHTLRWDHWRSL